MPITPDSNLPNSPPVFKNVSSHTIGAYSPCEPPYPVSHQLSPQNTIDFDRELMKCCVDLIADFIESGELCWASNYASPTSPYTPPIAKEIDKVLRLLAPSNIAILRRAATIYLLRKS